MPSVEWIKQNYPGYAGWNDPAAIQADFAATGGVGKEPRGESTSSSSFSVDSILSNAINSVTGMIKEPPKPYEEANPFFFDEQLARQSATAQYAPYYDETLSDYIATVERTKSRSQEDLRKIMDYLSASKEYFVGAERRLLDKAIRQANEGYAGAGLFFSGARQRDIKELKEESGAKLGEYELGYKYNIGKAQTTAERTLEDIETEKEQKQRDIEREKKFAIESGVLQRKSEAQEEYEAGRKKYYEDYLYGIV